MNALQVFLQRQQTQQLTLWFWLVAPAVLLPWYGQ